MICATDTPPPTTMLLPQKTHAIYTIDQPQNLTSITTCGVFEHLEIVTCLLAYLTYHVVRVPTYGQKNHSSFRLAVENSGHKRWAGKHHLLVTLTGAAAPIIGMPCVATASRSSGRRKPLTRFATAPLFRATRILPGSGCVMSCPF